MQIIRVTSEALQATVRRLLPSQQGFGEDLEATNVITPIIDLTPTAEGSQLPDYLQRAISYQNVTTTQRNASGTDTLASTPGFYAYYSSMSIETGSTAQTAVDLRLTSPLAGDKVIHRLFIPQDTTTAEDPLTGYFEGVCFLDTGETLQQECSSARAAVSTAVYQIADRYGNLNNPGGFTFE